MNGSPMNTQIDHQRENRIKYSASDEQNMAALLHEIKSPLNVILLGLSSLAQETLSERGRLRIGLALEEAMRLQRMLRKSWLSGKYSHPKWQALNLHVQLHQTLQLINTFLASAQCQLTLKSTYSDVCVFGDPDQLKQVFINLINNACEATPQGREIICYLGVDSANHQAYFTIQNWGDPIPAELLSQLTKPFVTTKPHGTGLGLTIVKQIVDIHGGCLQITSSHNFGTSVTVRLPKL